MMQRRGFIKLSAYCVLPVLTWAQRLKAETQGSLCRSVRSVVTAGSPKAMHDITLAVDAILPADPLVADDFAASSYGGDSYVAAKLGFLGQTLAVWHLNFYSLKTSRRLFAAGSEEQRLTAIRDWIHDRDRLTQISKDLLSGLLFLSIVGTFEGKPQELRDQLYAKMGWFDPARPYETYHVPCDGYSNLPR